MKSTTDDAAKFREECLLWQGELGLTDWTLQFTVQDSTGSDEADVDFDCDTRHAKITYYVGVDDALHPSDVACHEILHLLLADMCLVAIESRNEEDPLLSREEHKVIERLLKVLGKKRRR